MKKFVIEKDKLAENSRLIQKKAGVLVIAVLKADGYGFGMAQMRHFRQVNDLCAARDVLAERNRLCKLNKN